MINLVPETYSAPPAARRRYIWRSSALVVLQLVLFIAYYALGGGDETVGGLDVAMMAITVLFVGAATYEIVMLIRALDELQQRIHILSWAIACALAVSVSFLWGVASVLVSAPSLDPILTMVIAVPAYYVVLFAAGRHFA
ncbi:MAG: hypothetical protein ACQRW7_13440 [Caulobacterales bacterium]|uniref:hypothetical protein n=1 Tax=Glycocaulis sp. TaxID=1969725 RepID=UPI003FA02847